jgi:hypothetical protein
VDFLKEIDMRKSFTLLTSIFVVVLCLGLNAFAQRTTGDIQGTVKDANGAIIPNASVTVTGSSVGFNRTVQSDDEGVFRVLQVPPGAYTVTVAAISGFAAQKQEVLVESNKTAAPEFAMAAKVGVDVTVTAVRRPRTTRTVF